MQCLGIPWDFPPGFRSVVTQYLRGVRQCTCVGKAVNTAVLSVGKTVRVDKAVQVDKAVFTSVLFVGNTVQAGKAVRVGTTVQVGKEVHISGFGIISGSCLG